MATHPPLILFFYQINFPAGFSFSRVGCVCRWMPLARGEGSVTHKSNFLSRGQLFSVFLSQYEYFLVSQSLVVALALRLNQLLLAEFMCERTCMHAYQRSTSVSSLDILHLFSEPGLSVCLPLIQLDCLANEPKGFTCLQLPCPLPHAHWSCWCIPPCLVILSGCWGSKLRSFCLHSRHFRC